MSITTQTRPALSRPRATPGRLALLAVPLALALAGCGSTPTRQAPEPANTVFPGDAVTTRPAEDGHPDANLLTVLPSQPNPDAAPPEATDTPATPHQDPAATGEPAHEPETRSVTIDLSDQRFDYLEDGEVVRSGPISSGTKGHSTPTGHFKALSKNEDKVSSRYTNQLGMQAWMPYSIQFHGNYFLHEGWLPGYPDSHGCVRVGARDAKFLFEHVKIGDPINVVR